MWFMCKGEICHTRPDKIRQKLTFNVTTNTFHKHVQTATEAHRTKTHTRSNHIHPKSNTLAMNPDSGRRLPSPVPPAPAASRPLAGDATLAMRRDRRARDNGARRQRRGRARRTADIAPTGAADIPLLTSRSADLVRCCQGDAIWTDTVA